MLNTCTLIFCYYCVSFYYISDPKLLYNFNNMLQIVIPRFISFQRSHIQRLFCMQPVNNIYVPNIRVGTYSCCFNYIQNIRCLYACMPVSMYAFCCRFFHSINHEHAIGCNVWPRFRVERAGGSPVLCSRCVWSGRSTGV